MHDIGPGRGNVQLLSRKPGSMMLLLGNLSAASLRSCIIVQRAARVRTQAASTNSSPTLEPPSPSSVAHRCFLPPPPSPPLPLFSTRPSRPSYLDLNEGIACLLVSGAHGSSGPLGGAPVLRLLPTLEPGAHTATRVLPTHTVTTAATLLRTGQERQQVSLETRARRWGKPLTAQ